MVSIFKKFSSMHFGGSYGLPYLCDLLPPHHHDFSLSVCFSSESEMEEEEEGSSRATSEEARASWRETLQLHLRDDQEEEEEEEEEDEEDEEEEDEEEGCSEVESSDGESQFCLCFRSGLSFESCILHCVHMLCCVVL